MCSRTGPVGFLFQGSTKQRIKQETAYGPVSLFERWAELIQPRVMKSNTATLWVHRIRANPASHADFLSGTGNSMTFPR